MGKVARNALKGYTFQHYIFTLFLAKMDSDRAIKKIESEAITDGNFDDLYCKFLIRSYKKTSNILVQLSTEMPKKLEPRKWVLL